VSVVIADTTFALTQFNGSPLPVLVAADSVLINGVPEFDEVYAESGTLVLSGLMQLRYQLDVRFSQYHVIRTGNTVQRELRFQQREFDRGLVTVGAGHGWNTPRRSSRMGFWCTSGSRATMRSST
jgi:hypothetical protein